ncbi:hypothetical protein CWO36_24275 [Vibrio splendidus]|uniref:Uncharacterized protein n=2 Tax=Vibrio splendidus TaxID=29497 RepID=A0A2T5DXA9_VIBSP|nr:hypothetical protein CWO36_24275 [Vibrio splendidus]
MLDLFLFYIGVLNMNKRLEKIFNKYIDSFQIVSGINKTSLKQVRLFGNEYSITKWGDQKYRDGVKNVIQCFPNNSSSLIEEYFSSALLQVLLAEDKKEKIIEECTKLIDQVNRNTQMRSVCIPVEGIDLKVDCLDFGFGKLYKSDVGVLPTIIKDNKSLHSYQHGINALENCMCYFEIEDNTDHRKSLESAKSLTQYALNLLNFYIGSTQFRTDPSFNNWHNRIKETECFRKRRIAIYGSESNYSQVYYEFYQNTEPYPDSEYSLEFNLLSSGHDDSQRLNESMDLFTSSSAKATYHLIDNNVKASILSTNIPSLLSCVKQKSEIEKRIFQSINWFGKAINSEVFEEQFLFFAISIESLLVGNEPDSPFANQGSITQKISDRSAFLIGKDFNSRVKIEKDLKKLYGLRSKIVHTGAKVKNTDVIKIECLAKKLILKFSKENYLSHESFIEWIKRAQYGI